MSTPTTIVRGIGPRNGFPDYVVKSLKSDRYGILAGKVERRWKVGKEGQRIDPDWVSILLAPDPGWAIPCVDADGQIEDGQFVVGYAYEGTNPKGPEPTDEQKTFSLKGTMGDRRIELHPRYQELVAMLGWDPDTRSFPQIATGTGGSTAGALKLGTPAGTRSPLAGVDSWFYIGITYSITYASRTIPDTVLAKIGTLISAPPNIGKFKLPKATQNRAWLVMAPQIELRGNTAQITEDYLLGEPGGLPQLIYGAGQLTV